MNIPFRSTGKSIALAIAAIACMSTAAFAQEGQQPVCERGTAYRYDGCEATAVPAPGGQELQRQSDTAAPKAHAVTPSTVAHQPPRHAKPAPPNAQAAKYAARST
jgi:hypothetical protein